MRRRWWRRWKKAGYGAEMIQDETERRERQQQTARANMKRFSWQAALGLALGIPLMAWGCSAAA